MTPDRTSERLRTALGGLAGEVGGPRRVDAEAVFRQARTARRRRSVVAACAALLVTAGIAGTALATVGRPTDPVTDASPPVSTSPLTPAPTSASPSTAPSSTAPTASSASTSASTCTACGHPDAGNTGVPPGTTLTKRSGDVTIREDGTVIDGWDLDGSLDIYADNVTIRNSRITSSNWWGVYQRDGFNGLTIQHSTITGVPGRGPDNGAEDYAVHSNGTVEIGWCDISRFANPLSVRAGTVHDNYVHQIQPAPDGKGGWQGTNGITMGGGSREPLVIRHNTVLNDRGGTSAIGLFADNGPVTDVVVADNLLGGGQYAFYGGGSSATRVRVTGNRFTTTFFPTGGVHGPVASWNGAGSGNVWRDNVWADGPQANRPVSP